jgi:hypothetical protein
MYGALSALSAVSFVVLMPETKDKKLPGKQRFKLFSPANLINETIIF